jgi:hypothetical protein
MHQFDVFRNPSEASSKFAPMLLVLQSALTITETTVVVAPLVLPNRIPEDSRLFPRLTVRRRNLVLSTNELGAVQKRTLKVLIANLEPERYRIIAAIDMLFSGF